MKAKLTILLAVFLLILSACGLVNTPAGNPNTTPPTPYIQPTQNIMTEPPTQNRTPEPTIEPTPTPEPIPTPLALFDAVNIGDWLGKKNNNVKDNYGENYVTAYRIQRNHRFETLLDNKYNTFTCTLFVAATGSDLESALQFKLDGQIIYSTDPLNKYSRPVSINIDISGGNIFEIISDPNAYPYLEFYMIDSYLNP